jgi:predicted MFS family arabinose efflux permease
VQLPGGLLRTPANRDLTQIFLSQILGGGAKERALVGYQHDCAEELGMLKQPSVHHTNADLIVALAVSLLVQTAISILASSVPLLAPMLADARGWKSDLIAFYAPMVYVVAFAMNFLVPYLLAQFGGMGLNLLCIVGCATGLGCLLFDNLAVCAMSTLGIGVAMGMMNPASAQVLGPKTSPATAGTIMAIKQTGIPLGGIFAGILIPAIAIHYGWEWAILIFIIGSAMLVGSLLPAVRSLNGDVNASGGNPPNYLETLRELLGMPGMWAIMVAAGTFSAALVCFRTFIAVYLVKELGLSLVLGGLALSVSQAAGIIGQIGWAAVSDRFLKPHTTLTLIGFLIACAAALMAGFSERWHAGAICAVVAIYGAGAPGFMPVVLGEVARRAAPEKVGAVTSAANFFLLGGIIIGPLLFGALASLVSYSIAFGGLAGCVLVASFLGPARARS